MHNSGWAYCEHRDPQLWWWAHTVCVCVCGFVQHCADEVQTGSWLDSQVTWVIKTNQRNPAEVALMNHDHTVHEPWERHTHTHTTCLPKVQPGSLSQVFPGDYANDGAEKGREDLKLIWWEQTLVGVIGGVMIESCLSPDYDSLRTINISEYLPKYYLLLCKFKCVLRNISCLNYSLPSCLTVGHKCLGSRFLLC